MMGGNEVMLNYPQRVGEIEDCRDFLRTGRCKYGETCKYHHPVGGPKATDPNEPPFPIRPSEPTCQYYLKNATCKFGQTCKFHHPPHVLLDKGTTNMLDPATGSLSNINVSMVPRVTRQPLDSVEDCHVSNGSNPGTERQSFTETLPQRPGEPDCIYYLRNGKCKYGSTCKYHHPTIQCNANNGNMVIIQHPNVITRERSASDSIQETRSPQSHTASMRRNSTTQMLSPSTLYHQNPRHHQVHNQGALETIEHSFHQNQYPNVALDMNNVTIMGNFQNFSNAPNSSPKMGSPSMSSTTLASSYDTASLETLPPSRVQGQSVGASSSSQQMNSSRGNSYPDLPKFSMQPQVNSVPPVRQQYSMYNMNLNHSQMKEQLAPAMQLCVPVYQHQSNFNDNAILRNTPDFGPLPDIDIQSQHQLQQRIQSSRQPLIHCSTSSNTSIASVSAASSEPNNEFLPSDNYQHSRGIMTNANSKNNNLTSDNPRKQFRSIDDGLSMMTDALLTMLDTPDDGSNPNSASLFEQERNDDNNMNYHHQSHRMNGYNHNPNGNNNNVPSFRLPNSLPDFLLSDNSSRTMNNTNISNRNGGLDFDYLSQSSHQPMNLRFDHNVNDSFNRR
jgi:hypothetical protein